MKLYSYTKSSTDRSGAQINEEIFAWGHSYKNDINYLGSFGDFNFNDHYILSKMLNMPLPVINKPKDWEKHILLTSNNYSSVDPNDFLNTDFLEMIRKRYWSDKEKINYKHPKVCIHIRRGDVRMDNIQGRYVPNKYFIGLINKIREISPNSNILVFSESNSDEDFKEFYDLGCEVNLDCDLCLCWHEMITSDVFIMSVGSFSYVPAIYNEGFVIFHPAWYTKLNHWNNNNDPNLIVNLKEFLKKRYNEL